MTQGHIDAVDALKRANRNVMAAGLALAGEGLHKHDPRLRDLRDLVGRINAARALLERGPEVLAHEDVHSKVAS